MTRQPRGARPPPRQRRRPGPVLCAALLAVGAFGVLRSGATPGAANPGERSPRASSDAIARGPGSLTDSIQTFYDSLAALEARIPPSAVELPALAARLGPDPEALLRFVADSIRYEHYEGVLRGAFGTFLSRAGNSCDQALFLQALLAAHGTESAVRVAAAGADLDSALAARAIRQAPEAPAPAERDSLRARVEAHLERLTSAAPDFAAALGAAVARRPIGHYCRLEAAVGGEGRVLDPLSDAEVAPPAETALGPSDLRFTVTTSVLLDTESDGRTETAVLTSVAFATDTLGLDPIVISVVPERGDLLDSLKAGGDVDAALQAMDTFHPVVSFRGRHHASKGFNLGGEVVEPGTDALADGAALGGRLQGLLGGGAAPSAADRQAAERSLRALHLTYEIRSPDGAVETARRELVRFPATARGPAERAAVLASIVQQRQVLVPTFAVPPAYWARRLVDFFRRNRNAVEYLARFDGEAAEAPPPLEPYPFQLLLLSMLQDAAARQLVEPGRGVLARTAPAVLALKQEFEAAGGGVTRIDGVDIVSTGFGALNLAGKGKGARAMLGIYSSLLEAAVLQGSEARSLPSLVERAEARGIPTVEVATARDPRLADLELTPGQRRALVDDLRPGRSVVALARPLPGADEPAFGWWRLDRGTGEVLGILENREGGAQTATEYFIKSTVAGILGGAAFGYVSCWLSTQALDADDHPLFGDPDCVGAAYCGALVGGLVGATSGVLDVVVGGGVALGFLSDATLFGTFGGFCGVVGAGGIFDEDGVGPGPDAPTPQDVMDDARRGQPPDPEEGQPPRQRRGDEPP